MNTATFLLALMIVVGMPCLIVITAIWASALKAKYRSQQGNISEAERNQLERLVAVADKMSERIETLESILDHEIPDWREDHEQK